MIKQYTFNIYNGILNEMEGNRQRDVNQYRLGLIIIIIIIMSDDSPAAPSPESLKALRDKHPRASSNLSDLAAARSESVSVDE